MFSIECIAFEYRVCFIGIHCWIIIYVLLEYIVFKWKSFKAFASIFDWKSFLERSFFNNLFVSICMFWGRKVFVQNVFKDAMIIFLSFTGRMFLNMKNAVTFKYDSLLSIWEEMFFEYVHFLFKNILVAQIHFQYMCCCRRLVWRGIYTRSCGAEQEMLRTPKVVVLRRRASLLRCWLKERFQRARNASRSD